MIREAILFRGVTKLLATCQAGAWLIDAQCPGKTLIAKLHRDQGHNDVLAERCNYKAQLVEIAIAITLALQFTNKKLLVGLRFQALDRRVEGLNVRYCDTKYGEDSVTVERE